MPQVSFRSISSVPAAPAMATASPVKVLRAGNMEFVVRRAEPPVQASSARRRPNGLPFLEWFGSMEPGDSVFLPAAFWEERGVNAKAEVVKTRLRDRFKVWQANPEHAEGRTNHTLYLVTRRRGVDGWEEGDGVELFMRLRDPSAE